MSLNDQRVPTASDVPPSPPGIETGAPSTPQAAGADPLAELLARPRYEVFPSEGIEEEVAAVLSTDITVTVTSSPARGLDATLRLAERLAKRGYAVVPHLAARLVADRIELSRILRRLDAAGVRDVFVVAGDSEQPNGDFSDALALLRAIGGHAFEDVGVAGYPERHPLIDDERLMRALLDKAPLATYVVSQVCFEAAPIADWIARLRRLDVGLPVLVGIPGIVERRRLLRIATRIGVGESMGFLRKHRTWAARLLLPAAYRPDRLVEGLRPSFTDPQAGVSGLHVYTLNELANTESWRRRKLKAGAPRP